MINESRNWHLNPQRFSSWTRLVRVHAWVSRFLDNCCLSKEQLITGELMIDEIRNAENQIIVQARRQANLSSHFWIIAARREIRDWEKNCMECRRRKAKPASQVIAPLPRIRVKKPLRVFCKIAVDFAGPMFTIQGRGKAGQKRYLRLFTCLLSRAMHLELIWT